MVQLPRCARCSATWSALGAVERPGEPPVSEHDHAVGVGGGLRVMGDHHDRVTVRVHDLA